jgi:hypothetical protein
MCEKDLFLFSKYTESNMTNLCVENRQVFGLYSLNQQIFLMYGLYSKFGLYKTLFYSGFGSDMFHCVIKQCV